VRQVIALAGEDPPGSPFVSAADVRLRVTHSVSGNPNRFQTGPIELRPDSEWRHSLGAAHRALVTAVTWPLLLRYGYPVRG
jgi:hypothetical protein